ncbi:hypothetical protein [Lacibacter sp. H407]|uniref:hypothetical protein n=1 Tax=Lacibacter sp. H407 TaxID=3133423 RepID=UPI0030BD5DF5
MGYWMFEMFDDYLSKAKKLSAKDKQSVYEIVTYAIRSTKTFITNRRRNNNDEASNILSMLWQDASSQLKKYGDEELKSFANMLEEKSKYWADPKGYDFDELKQYGMMLTQVELKLKELTS